MRPALGSERPAGFCGCMPPPANLGGSWVVGVGQCWGQGGRLSHLSISPPSRGAPSSSLSASPWPPRARGRWPAREACPCSGQRRGAGRPEAAGAQCAFLCGHSEAGGPVLRFPFSHRRAGPSLGSKVHCPSALVQLQFNIAGLVCVQGFRGAFEEPSPAAARTLLLGADLLVGTLQGGEVRGRGPGPGSGPG